LEKDLIYLASFGLEDNLRDDINLPIKLMRSGSKDQSKN